jgi:prolyl-tRNA synthetase
LELPVSHHHGRRALGRNRAAFAFDQFVEDDIVFEVAEKLASDLEATGTDVLLDDRPKLSPGVKFADAEILGVPHIVIVGRGAAEGQVEYWNRRTGEKSDISLDQVSGILAR